METRVPGSEVIQVTLDLSAFEKSMDRLIQDQLPFGTFKAINALALEVQTGVRQHVHSEFIVRRSDYIDRSIKIPKFARKTDSPMSVTVQVDPAHDVLSKFEDGGQKTPRAGGTSIAVPFAARPTATSIIAKNLRPKALQLITVRTRSGKTRTIGQKHTFLITMANGKRGIFQRTGDGPRDIRLLYWLTPSVHIPHSLHFVDTSLKLINERWAPLFNEWMAEAIRTAR